MNMTSPNLIQILRHLIECTVFRKVLTLSPQKYRMIDSSFDIHIASFDHSHNTVTIYLRNYKKQAILQTLYSPIRSKDLHKIISNKFRLPSDKLALFSHGVRLDCEDRMLELRDNSIVHVVNIQRTLIPTLTLYFKEVAQTGSTICLTTTPTTTIRTLLQNDLRPLIGKDEKQVFFAYLGKPINIFKTFQEEMVEDGCEITILQFKSPHYNATKTINHTREYKDVASIASTKMLCAPVGMNMNYKEIVAVKNKQSFQKRKLEESVNGHSENAAPIHEKEVKNQAKSIVEYQPKTQTQNAGIYDKFATELKNSPKQQKQIQADHMKITEVKPFTGFNIHEEAAPKQLKTNIPRIKQSSKIETPAAPSSTTDSNHITLKQKDFIYFAESSLPQTENLYAGVIEEFKQEFEKKKSSNSSNSSHRSDPPKPSKVK